MCIFFNRFFNGRAKSYGDMRGRKTRLFFHLVCRKCTRKRDGKSDRDILPTIINWSPSPNRLLHILIDPVF